MAFATMGAITDNLIDEWARMNAQALTPTPGRRRSGERGLSRGLCDPVQHLLYSSPGASFLGRYLPDRRALEAIMNLLRNGLRMRKPADRR